MFDYRAEVLEKGFAVVRNVLTRDEILFLRKILVKYFKSGDYVYLFGGKTKPDAFNAPGLKGITWLSKKPELVRIMKELAGEEVRLCNHSDAHFNLIGGWHKDNYGRDDFNALADGQSYGVYKFAIYLQDHPESEKENYALKVRVRSHLSPVLESGPEQAIYARAGDVLVFDCRISHLGQSNVLYESRLGKAWVKTIMPFARDAKSKFALQHLFRKIMRIPDRLAIFFAFGKPNLFTDEHIEGNVSRQNQQNRATVYG